MKGRNVIILLFLIIFNFCSSQIYTNFSIIQDPSSSEGEYKLQKKNNLVKSFIEVETENIFNFRTLMKFCLGTPAQCFNLIVQTNSFHIMVSDYKSRVQGSKNKFDYSKSSTIVRSSEMHNLKFYGQKIKGQEASDILTLGGKTLSRINFLLMTNSGKFRFEDGFIGLGYTPRKDEKKFSIIQQLFENGEIPHKVFSQKYTDNLGGKMVIGEIPKYIVQDYTHYGRCKALNKIKDGKEYKNNNWECNIDQIFYGNEGDKNTKNIANYNSGSKKSVIFLSFRDISVVPKDIFEKFGQTYLKDAINSKKCSVNEMRDFKFYECDPDTKLEQLNFVFDSWLISISGDKLLENSKMGKNKKEFIFYYRKDFEKFLFGSSLLKELEMVYDYANKQIGFYHKNVKYIGNEKVSPPKVYDFLPDDSDVKETRISQPGGVIPNAVPEEITRNKYESVEQDKRLYLSDILKYIFEFLIFLVGVCLVGFIVIYGLKMRRKSQVKKSNQYLKKQRLMEMK
jgi:hypothetical protein